MSEINEFTKLRILQFCKIGSTWTDIMKFTGKARTTVSQQLKNLLDRELLKKEHYYEYKTTRKGEQYIQRKIKLIKNEFTLLEEIG